MNGGFVRGLNVTITQTQGTTVLAAVGSQEDLAVLGKLINTVSYVEEDVILSSAGMLTPNPMATSAAGLDAWPPTVASIPPNFDYTTGNWGLKAVANGSPFAGFGADGEGVDVYVISHGIDVSHPQFEGKKLLKTKTEISPQILIFNR